MKRILFFLLFFQLLACPPSFAKERYKHKLAVCMIFQNEAPYLKEWIEFHKLVGVDYFYLYNNLSHDLYKEELESYIASGVVQLIDWPYKPSASLEWSTIQCGAYNHALKLSKKKKIKWLAVLDSDEFLVPVEAATIPEFLKDYKKVASIAVNWQLYGTSHVYKVEKDQLMIENLIYKAPKDFNENLLTKPIVRPKYVKKFENPHYAILKSGHYKINSDHKVFSGAKSPYVVTDKIRINHYWSRDEEFFHRVKLGRRQGWQDGGSYERLNQLNQEPDLIMLKHTPKLKEIMFQKK